MKNISAEIKIGVTSFLALIIIVVAIILGKDIRLSGEYYNLQIIFPNVLGLESGARVTVSGINMGKVVGFELHQEGVLVTVSVKNDVRIYQDARAVIETPEMMGQKVVALYPGSSGNILSESQIIKGHTPIGFAEIFDTFDYFAGKIEETLNSVQQITDNVAALLQDTSNIYLQLSDGLENLNALSHSLLDMIETNRTMVDSTLVNINCITSDVYRIVSTHEADIDSIVSNFRVVSSDLRRLSAHASSITEIIDRGEGSVGKLINNEEFYNNLLHTIENLDSLLQQILHEGIKTRMKFF